MKFEELIEKLSPKLKGIAYRLNGRYTVLDHDDLYQEALKHLWQFYREGKLEGKTDSYILQGCYFYLKNFLRGFEDNTFFINLDEPVGEDNNSTVADFLAENSQVEEEIERKLLVSSIYGCGLSKREKEILQLYALGLTVREVGEHIGVSHVSVVKTLERIKEKAKSMADGGC